MRCSRDKGSRDDFVGRLVLKEYVFADEFLLQAQPAHLRVFQFYVLVETPLRPVGFRALAALEVTRDLARVPSNALCRAGL